MTDTGRPSLKGSGRQHSHSNFQARSARDEAGELNRRYSMLVEESSSPGERARPTGSSKPPNPYEPDTNASTPPPHDHSRTRRLLHLPSPDAGTGSSDVRKRSVSGRRRIQAGAVGEDSLTVHMHNATESKKANGGDISTPKPGLGPRPIGGVEKLGMFSGVYVPTCLNVLSILMFLRFGFILGLWHFKLKLSWAS